MESSTQKTPPCNPKVARRGRNREEARAWPTGSDAGLPGVTWAAHLPTDRREVGHAIRMSMQTRCHAVPGRVGGAERADGFPTDHPAGCSYRVEPDGRRVEEHHMPAVPALELDQRH